jgi:hypothetical protein
MCHARVLAGVVFDISVRVVFYGVKVALTTSNKKAHCLSTVRFRKIQQKKPTPNETRAWTT